MHTHTHTHNRASLLVGFCVTCPRFIFSLTFHMLASIHAVAGPPHCRNCSRSLNPSSHLSTPSVSLWSVTTVDGFVAIAILLSTYGIIAAAHRRWSQKPIVFECMSDKIWETFRGKHLFLQSWIDEVSQFWRVSIEFKPRYTYKHTHTVWHWQLFDHTMWPSWWK